MEAPEKVGGVDAEVEVAMQVIGVRMERTELDEEQGVGVKEVAQGQEVPVGVTEPVMVEEEGVEEVSWGVGVVEEVEDKLMGCMQNKVVAVSQLYSIFFIKPFFVFIVTLISALAHYQYVAHI